MPRHHSFSRPGYSGLAASLITAALVLASTAPAHAQSGFLFGRPDATISVMAGWDRPNESDELFEHTRTFLTVERGDFQSPLLLAEVALRATERLDVAAGLEHASQTVHSEDRDYVTMDDQPIPQRTTFARTRLMGTVKAYLFPRGREISELAWVPRSWSPYVGVGGGQTWYRFHQVGDFVDFETLDIFEGEIDVGGRGWTAHALGGVQVSLNPRLLLRGEYRYLWGRGYLSAESLSGFDHALDLSGSRVIIGLALRL